MFRIEIGLNVLIPVKELQCQGFYPACQLPANLLILRMMVLNEVQIPIPQVIPQE